MDEDEVARWIHLDGPEPGPIHAFLDALRELPPATEADKARRVRAVLDLLDADLGAPEERRAEATGAPPEATPGTGEGQGEHAPPFPARPLKVAEPDPEDAPPRPEVPLPQAPPAATALAALASTSLHVTIPKEVLPFKPAAPAPAAPPPPAPSSPKTEPSLRAVPPGFGSTANVGDAIAVALSSLPFESCVVGDTIVNIPRLTPTKYAWLCLEMARLPEKKSEIMKSYDVVSDVALTTLHIQWREKLVNDPALRAEHLAAVDAYHRHLVDLLPK